MNPPKKKTRLIEGDSAYRKMFPMAEGLLDYFPDALAAVSNLSFLGNAKHNKDEPLHHARSKSTDHADCIMRHLTERGGFDTIMVDGTEYRVRHSVALAWRALALAQEEIEQEENLPLPLGARP
jgi:dATP/dGTP diphosphohydrolase, N-terminal